MITSRVAEWTTESPLEKNVELFGKSRSGRTERWQRATSASEQARFRQRSYAARESSEVRPKFEDQENFHRITCAAETSERYAVWQEEVPERRAENFVDFFDPR